MTPPRGAGGGAGDQPPEPQLIHIPQNQPVRASHNQATENYRSQMAKFFQMGASGSQAREDVAECFDGTSRIHTGRSFFIFQKFKHNSLSK